MYSYYFQTNSIEHNPTLTNWESVQVRWETTPETEKQIIIEKNHLTRKQISFFDNRHKQATTIDPLPTEGKYVVKVKIVKYGNSPPFDSVYFGLITQKHKKNEYSDGRHRGSIAYLSAPDNITELAGRGTILMDGVQIAYGEDLFLSEGDEVKMELNMSTSELTFINKRKSVTLRVNASYDQKKLFLFTSLCAQDSCISWHSSDSNVWN